MNTIDPKKIEPLTTLRKPIVKPGCIGCGTCVAISGDVFELDDNGYSLVKSLPSYEGKHVEDSISACPVNVIAWNDAK